MSAPQPATRAAGLAVEGVDRTWTPAQIEDEAKRIATRLAERGVRVLATLSDNSPAWVVADLAAARAGVVHVPLPLFFTPMQWMHAIRSAGVDALLAAPGVAQRLAPQGAGPAGVDVAGESLELTSWPAQAASLPDGTAKITFTSGTTGNPKGVCLSHESMHAVAASVAQALAPLDIDRHLCALPLPVLLENIAGLMAPALRGATCVVLPLRQLGLAGSSSFDPAVFQQVIGERQPNSLILLPQMLRAWSAHLLRHGQRAPASLRMVAVGGAPVGARSIELARSVGIPAYEGYGLSEGTSVQALNLPGADRPGSAGRPLPHAQVRCTETGEIEVAGSLFLGYIGEPRRRTHTWWPSGDLGHIDADGFVHVHGRKKNVLITGFGRNVAPEWVETALRSEPAVHQAVVMGDGQAQLCAVLWPSDPAQPDAALQAAVDAANLALPDYARVGRWTRGVMPFTHESGMATPNGRPQRALIERLHAPVLGLSTLVS